MGSSSSSPVNGILSATTAHNIDADYLLARLERIPLIGLHRRLLVLLGIGLLFVSYNTLIVSFTITGSAAALHFDPDKNALAAGTLIDLGFLAQGLGALGMGWLGDKWGRKNILLVALVLHGLGGILSGLANSLPLLVAFHVLQGIGLGVQLPLAIVLLNEMVPASQRRKQAILLASWYAWGNFLMPLVANRVVSSMGSSTAWGFLLIGGGVLPLICGFLCWLFVPESARWLIAKGRLTEAEGLVEQFERAVKQKNLPLAPVATLSSEDKQVTENKALLWRSLLALWSQWFVAYFLITSFSNGMPLMFETLGLQNLSVGLIIAFGTAVLLCAYLLIWATRRGDYRHHDGLYNWMVKSYYVTAGAAIVGALLVPFLHVHTELIFIAGVLVSLGAFVVFCNLYAYSVELFSTSTRLFAVGSGRAWQCLGTIIAPFLTFTIHHSLGLIWVFVLWLLVSLLGWSGLILTRRITRAQPLSV